MNSSSPANSSISTTAIVGGGGASATNTNLEDFHFPSDLISIQDRKDEAMLGLFVSSSFFLGLLPFSLDYAFCVKIVLLAIWVILFLH